jgi:hypothetical protein
MTKTGYENIPAAPPEETAVAVVVVDDTTFMDEPALPVQERAANVQPSPTSLRLSPVHTMMCPDCSETDIDTRTRAYSFLTAWIAVPVGIIVISLVFEPLCWIPLVLQVVFDPFKQTDQYCQRCGEKVGEVGPLEDCCVREQV